MIVSEILAFSRGLLDDDKIPYLWSQEFLLACYNQSVNDVFRYVKHLTDHTTASVCHIDVLSGLALHSISQKIIEIKSAVLTDILSGNKTILEKKSEAWLDFNLASTWRDAEGTPRYYIPEAEPYKIQVQPYYEDIYVVTGASNISFVAATKTISKPSGGLSIYEEDDILNVSGTVSNEGNLTIATVSNTAITVNETPVNETLVSAVLRKVMGTINLSVARFPLTSVLISDLTVSPPLDEDFHMDLCDGILSYAYQKNDTETYNPKKAMEHKILFRQNMGKISAAYLKKTHTTRTIGPMPGAL